MPLLLDPQKGRAANPHLPEYDLHFNWREDALHHMRQALDYMEKTFGRKPKGIWPSEGSLSAEVLEMLDQLGITWTATDETNLSKSLHTSIHRDHDFIVTNQNVLYKPYVLTSKEGEKGTDQFLDIRVFFRDCHLSDLIGFHYRKMPYKKAAADLVERIKKCNDANANDMVVPVILDGENAWEFYDEGGRPFLKEFFRLVSEDEDLEAVTFSEAAESFAEPGVIPFENYSAGSWINGNFDIWIGDEEDRKGWRLLEKARQALENKKDRLAPEVFDEARSYLSIAQGSDWFWWFGKENYTADLDIFDNLFRRNMQKIFDLVGEDIPDEFYEPVATVSIGRGAGVSVEQPSAPLTVKPDGRAGSYLEWLSAGRMDASALGGAMNISNPLTGDIAYGFNSRFFFMKVETAKYAADYFNEGYELDVLVKKRGKPARFPVIPGKQNLSENQAGDGTSNEDIRSWVGNVIELAISLETLKLKPGDYFYLQLEWRHQGHLFQAVPAQDFFRLTVPTAKDYARNWQV
jgi:hypothetical protein